MLRAKLVRLWPLAVLLLLFGVSVLLRVGSFSIDPVADKGWTAFGRFNNTEVWQHDKYVLDVYANYPARDHKFAAYVGTSPEFIPNQARPELTVYTSFPATHFVALYASLKAFGGQLTYTGLQLFSLAIHLLCAVLIYYLGYVLSRNRLAALLGATVYVFSTGTLWNHMNVYWAHQLLMPVFLTALILFVRQKGLFRWWQGLALGFAMSLITWTGSVAVVGFALYGAYKFWRTRNRAYLSYLFMVGGMVAALVLIFAQVLFATGTSVPDYLSKVWHRARARTAGATSMPLPVMIWGFVSGLLLDYGGYMLIAYTLALRRKLRSFEWEVLFVASFPLIESLLILEHDTVYGFGRLKWLVPVILILVILGARFATTKKRRAALVAAVALASALHVALFFTIFGV